MHLIIAHLGRYQSQPYVMVADPGIEPGLPAYETGAMTFTAQTA